MKRLIASIAFPLALAAFAPQPPEEEAKHPLTAAEKRHRSSEITRAVTDQLVENQCWTDHGDLPEARRLRTTIRIWLGADGHFYAPPELIDPEQKSRNDKPLQAFTAEALRALDMCNTIGWKLPEWSDELLAKNYIDLTFVPKIGARE